ncbi:MAG: glycerophosphoryl diester phosphodiesterase membrane domain-containing protein [Bacilli bacterium]|nr:glycerophosphoryl diester phosphodiesterase membrane domain-containing protein [Bacilli bacterium]
MGKTNQTLNLLKYNMGTLLGFELIFKIMTILIGSPLFVGFFNMTMKITGYNYLTIENISNFMFHPITILSLLLLIVLMTIYTMFEITTIIILLEEARQKKKIRLIDAVKASIEKCKKLLSPKNVLLPFLVLFMIPVLNIGISSSLISTIKIPEFIMDYITSNNTLILIFIGLFALLLYFLFRWIYSIHYMVLEDKDFRSARKSSVKLGKFHRIRDLITLGITHFYIFFMLILFVLLGILFLLMIHKVLLEELFAKAILTSIITIMIGVTIFIYAILSTPINYAVISCMYYEKKEKQKENIPNLNITSDPKKNIGLKVLITILMFCSIGLGTYFIDGLYKGKYNLNIEYIRTMEVTAHRGASVAYPENTMSAFIGAKKQGADWIELDVQQTKDQVIIVSHDTNLKRVTGINKDVIDLTYEEIEKLDAGSFKDTKFKGEKIPTLEEVIDFAKENNMRLNIELKPTGKEKDFQSKCVITSQVYEV